MTIMIRRIGIDVDGVVADLLQEWLNRYNLEYDDRLTKADVTHYDLNRVVKPAARNAIYNMVANPTIYDGVKPIEGAAQAIRDFRAAGWKVVFVSHCFRRCYEQKLEWLARYGFLDYAWEQGVRPHPDFIAARDKRWIDVSYLVDDHLQTVEEFSSTGKHGILFRSDRHPTALTWPMIVEALLGQEPL
jgi:5'(3')-deoxyribonucleotidase